MSSLATKAFLVCALIATAFAGGYLSGHTAGKNKQLADTVEAFQKRGKIDAAVDGKSDFELCIAVGGVREQCDELRGLDKAAPGQ